MTGASFQSTFVSSSSSSSSSTKQRRIFPHWLTLRHFEKRLATVQRKRSSSAQRKILTQIFANSSIFEKKILSDILVNLVAELSKENRSISMSRSRCFFSFRNSSRFVSSVPMNVDWGEKILAESSLRYSTLNEKRFERRSSDRLQMSLTQLWSVQWKVFVATMWVTNRSQDRECRVIEQWNDVGRRCLGSNALVDDEHWPNKRAESHPMGLSVSIWHRWTINFVFVPTNDSFLFEMKESMWLYTQTLRLTIQRWRKTFRYAKRDDRRLISFEGYRKLFVLTKLENRLTFLVWFLLKHFLSVERFCSFV